MSIGLLEGSGITTNYHLSDNIWYTTQSTDEIIYFIDSRSFQREVNDWQIFSDSTDLLIQLVVIGSDNTPIPVSDIIPILAGDSWSNGKIKIQGIKVFGEAGQRIRYIGNYY